MTLMTNSKFDFSKPFGYLRTVGKQDLRLLREHLEQDAHSQAEFSRILGGETIINPKTQDPLQATNALLRVVGSSNSISSIEIDTEIARLIRNSNARLRAVGLIALSWLKHSHDIGHAVHQILVKQFDIDVDDDLSGITEPWIETVEDLVQRMIADFQLGQASKEILNDITIAMQIVEDECRDYATTQLGCAAVIDRLKTQEHNWGWVFFFVAEKQNNQLQQADCVCLIDRLTRTVRPLNKIGLENSILRVRLWCERENAKLKSVDSKM
jgi:hypothetical protein